MRRKILTDDVLDDAEQRKQNVPLRQIADEIGVTYGTLKVALSRRRTSKNNPVSEVSHTTAAPKTPTVSHKLTDPNTNPVSHQPIVVSDTPISPKKVSEVRDPLQSKTARERIVLFLVSGGAWTIPELAERLHLTKTTVQKSIQRMPVGVVLRIPAGKLVLFRLDHAGGFSMARDYPD